MNADRAFLDTNVLIYAYSATETGKRDRARELKDATPSCVSTQVINEFIAVAWRKVGISIDDVRAIVQKLYETIPIVETGKPVILRALGLASKTGYSYWDCLIIAAALEAGSPILYSEDMQDGQMIEGLQIVNPFKE
ncbi:MAG: PIN domain-containing protein [Rectinemataceae bacterium]